MKRSSWAVHVVLLMVSIVALATLVQAQFRGSLRGTVTDSQGAAVSGATVTLINTDTNWTVVSTSSDTGLYEFNALEAAPYRLTAQAKGFKQKVLEHVVIIPEQPNGLDLQLDVGNVSESVTVSDTVNALDTETATLSGTITGNQIQHMPSFGRDVFQLIQLAPGVFGDGAQGSAGGAEQLPGTQGPGGTGGSTGIFATENGPQALAHGGQYENNGITVDGISTASAVWGGTTIITPSEDSVQDVKVVSNSYDSESGRFSGAQVQVTSKSGTNQFHGSLFFFAHRPGLDAYQRFNGLGNSKLRDNSFFDQFGGSVGGPIWKNKVFAFFNYETVRSPKAQTSVSNEWAETQDFANSAPSGSIAATYLTFPGSAIVNKGINDSTCADAGLTEGLNCAAIPGKGLDIGRPLTAGLTNQDQGWTGPQHPGTGGDGLGGANNLDGVADIANYITSSTSTYTKVQYNGRLDADVTAKDRIGFAIYWVPQSNSFLNGAARGYNQFNHSQVNEAYSGIWNHTFSPTLLNEARLNGAGWHWNEVTSNPQSPVGLPSDSIGQLGSINPQSFGPNVGSILNQWTYSGKDVATKIIRNHTIKFGGEVTRLFYLQDCAGCGVPNYNFFNLWDFLNDAPRQEGGGFDPTTGFPTTIRQDQRTDIWGFFAQDDFKVRPNLTVNLGLRWSYFGPLSSKQGNMLRADPGAGADYLTGLNIRKGNSWNAQKNNFGPQVGFAWSPTLFHDKLVLRGGYGLNYNQEEIAISANISNNPGLIVFPGGLTMSKPSDPNPGIIYAISSDVHSLFGYPANSNTVSTFGTNGLPTGGVGLNVIIFPHNLPTMRTHHYSLDMQYDLGHQWIMTVGYLGSLSRDTYFHENPLAVPATAGDPFNPQIGGGDYWGVSGSGNYNSLLTEMKHQFSHQFMADAQFAWSKSMDTSSAPYSEQDYPYNLNLNYGRSDYNVDKAFKLYGMWQPVLFHDSKSWVEKIAGGWSLSGIFNWHSGFPWSPVLSVQNGNLYCGQCNYSQILPSAYLGGAGDSTSNDQFKTGANYPNGSLTYFSAPLPCSNPGAQATNCYTPFGGSDSGTALPPAPGVRRNAFTGPGYRDVDLTLSKAFGLPKMPILGESARFEFRVDAYNIFNNLNFNPTSISNSIGDPVAGQNNPNFGRAQTALAARVVTLSARFSF